MGLIRSVHIFVLIVVCNSSAWAQQSARVQANLRQQAQDAVSSGRSQYSLAQLNMRTYERFAGEVPGMLANALSSNSAANVNAVRALLRDIETQLREAELLIGLGRFEEVLRLVNQGEGLNPTSYVIEDINCNNVQGVRARSECASRMATRLRDNLEPGAHRAAGGVVAAPVLAATACVSTMTTALGAAVGLEGVGIGAIDEVTRRANEDAQRQEAEVHLAQVVAAGRNPQPASARMGAQAAPAPVAAPATDSPALELSPEVRRRRTEQRRVNEFLQSMQSVTPRFRTQEQLVAAARAELGRRAGVGVLQEDPVLFALDAEALATEQNTAEHLAGHSERQARWRARLVRYGEVAEAAGRNPQTRRARVLAALAEDFPAGAAASLSGSMASVLDGSAAPNDELRTMIIHAALSQTSRVLGAGEKLGVQVFQDRVSPVVITGSGRNARVLDLATGEAMTPIRGKYFSPQVIFASYLEKLRGTDSRDGGSPAVAPTGATASSGRLAIALPDSTPTAQQLPEATRSQAARAASWLSWPAVNVVYSPPEEAAPPTGGAAGLQPPAEDEDSPSAEPASVPHIHVPHIQRPTPNPPPTPQWTIGPIRTQQQLRAQAIQAVNQMASGAAMPFDPTRFMLEVEAEHLPDGVLPRRRRANQARNQQRYEEATRSYEKTLQVIRAAIAQETDPAARIDIAMELLVSRHLSRYYRDDAGLLNGLNGGPGFNCQGETQMILGTIQALGLTPPPGMHIGVQVFNDHVQAVLYNPNGATGPETKNLLTGRTLTGTAEAPIYSPALVLVAYLGRHSPQQASRFLIVSPPASTMNGAGGGHPESMGMRNTNLNWPGAEAHFSDEPIPEHSTIARGSGSATRGEGFSGAVSAGGGSGGRAGRGSGASNNTDCRITQEDRNLYSLSMRGHRFVFTHANTASGICQYSIPGCLEYIQSVGRSLLEHAGGGCPENIRTILEQTLIEVDRLHWVALPRSVRDFFEGRSTQIPYLTPIEQTLVQDVSHYLSQRWSHIKQLLNDGRTLSPEFASRFHAIDPSNVRVNSIAQGVDYGDLEVLLKLFAADGSYRLGATQMRTNYPGGEDAYFREVTRAALEIAKQFDQITMRHVQVNPMWELHTIGRGSEFAGIYRTLLGQVPYSQVGGSAVIWGNFANMVSRVRARQLQSIVYADTRVNDDVDNLESRVSAAFLAAIVADPRATLTTLDQERAQQEAFELSRPPQARSSRTHAQYSAAVMGVLIANNQVHRIGAAITRDFNAAYQAAASQLLAAQSGATTVSARNVARDAAARMDEALANCIQTAQGWAGYLNAPGAAVPLIPPAVQVCVPQGAARAALIQQGQTILTQVQSNPRGVLAAVAQTEPHEAERLLMPMRYTQDQANVERTLPMAGTHPMLTREEITRSTRQVVARRQLAPVIDLLLAPGAVRVGRPPRVDSPDRTASPAPTQGPESMQLPVATDLGLGDNDIFVFAPPSATQQSVAQQSSRPAARQRPPRVSSTIYIPTQERYARLVLQLIALTNDPRLIAQAWRPEFKAMLQTAELSAYERLTLDNLP